MDSSNRELDQLDLTLIEELEIGARQTNRDLGKKLGVSATTVSNRIWMSWVTFLVFSIMKPCYRWEE